MFFFYKLRVSLGTVFKFMALVLVHAFQNYVNKFKYLSHFKSTVLLSRLEIKSFLKTGKCYGASFLFYS